MLQWQDLTTRGRHIAVHMSQSRGLSASEMACWKLVGLVSNCDEWMALWRSEISAGWHGGASTRALNNLHHGSLAADQMPWKPHLPTALAPVTESLLNCPPFTVTKAAEGPSREAGLSAHVSAYICAPHVHEEARPALAGC